MGRYVSGAGVVIEMSDAAAAVIGFQPAPAAKAARSSEAKATKEPAKKPAKNTEK